MCFCLINFNLDNVSSCIDMYLGIFVNRIEVEEEVEVSIGVFSEAPLCRMVFKCTIDFRCAF